MEKGINVLVNIMLNRHKNYRKRALIVQRLLNFELKKFRLDKDFKQFMVRLHKVRDTN